MAVRRSPHVGWGVLIVTSGLVVTITALGTYLTDRARAADDVPLRRCELASAILLDETPSPYISVKARDAVVRAAATTGALPAGGTMMSDLTIILLTIGLTLLSVGVVVMWQERRYADDGTPLRTDD